MSEDKESHKAEIEQILDSLNRDGHLIENAAALIASQAALARDHFADPGDAILRISDTLAGKRTEIPSEIIHRIMILRKVLGEDKAEIADSAMRAGIFSSDIERQELKTLSTSGMRVLREAALKLKVPSSTGDNQVTLGSKIQKLTPQK